MTERLAVSLGYVAMFPFVALCIVLAVLAETVKLAVKLWKL